MVDIHSHILPGIDDGSPDIFETLKMADMSVKSGVTKMVATPHCNIPGRYRNYFDENYIKLFDHVRDVFEREGVMLELLPGMEVFVTEDVPKLIKDGKIMPINKSHYVLIEFDFNEDPDFVRYMIDRIKDVSAKPLIAHAERYRFIQRHPEMLREWKNDKIVVQMNKGSFKGRFGKGAEEIAYMALNENLVDVISSDTHGSVRRTPVMDDVFFELSLDYDENYLKVLFDENPGRICSDRPVLIRKNRA